MIRDVDSVGAMGEAASTDFQEEWFYTNEFLETLTSNLNFSYTSSITFKFLIHVPKFALTVLKYKRGPCCVICTYSVEAITRNWLQNTLHWVSWSCVKLGFCVISHTATTLHLMSIEEDISEN